MGRILSIEWYNSNNDILVGYSRGTIEVYRAEGTADAGKPKQILGFNKPNLVTMHIESFRRAE